MSSVSNIKTVRHTYHPSMKLLAKFHGRIVRIFSPVPSKGKYQEVIKRVALAVVAPLAYLSLALVGIIGYPYTVSGIKNVSIQEDGDSSRNKNQTSNSGSDNVDADVNTQDGNTNGLQPDLNMPTQDTNITNETKNEAISNEKTIVSDELIKLIQDVYRSLLKINNKADPAHSSTSWERWIFLTIRQIATTMNDTLLILDNFVGLEDKIKRELELFSSWINKELAVLSSLSQVLQKEIPAAKAKIEIPYIALESNLKRDSWKNFSDHMINFDNSIFSFLHDKFFDQLKLSFGDKGDWFNKIFKNLESDYQYYLKEYQNLGVSYDNFYIYLDQHKLGGEHSIKDIANEHRVRFKKLLDQLEEKLKAFDLLDKNFGKIMELADKVSQ